MKKIYLVDDSRLHRHIIGRELSKLNYDVRSFGEARDLLTALDEQGLPDAIVSDVGMPQMDGRSVGESESSTQRAACPSSWCPPWTEITIGSAALKRAPMPIKPSLFSIRNSTKNYYV